MRSLLILALVAPLTTALAEPNVAWSCRTRGNNPQPAFRIGVPNAEDYSQVVLERGLGGVARDTYRADVSRFNGWDRYSFDVTNQIPNNHPQSEGTSFNISVHFGQRPEGNVWIKLHADSSPGTIIYDEHFDCSATR